ncbi:MAG: molecular chaperone [Clostridia bacterium]|nr:molecular chaperone [Clostridia bacterium]
MQLKIFMAFSDQQTRRSLSLCPPMKGAPMPSRLTKYEKETVLLYNQSRDPVIISTYDPGLRRRLREYAARYPELCRRVDKQKYPDYAEYEIQKDRVSIRLLPPMSEEKRKAASEKAKAAGLGTKVNT